jgi:hypothetical protein
MYNNKEIFGPQSNDSNANPINEGLDTFVKKYVYGADSTD